MIGIAATATAAPKADSLLQALQKQMNRVQDYQAKVNMNVNVKFIKMPSKTGTIYYKKPDKFHFDTKGFALLPRKGMGPTSFSILEGDYQAVYLKKQKVRGQQTQVVNIIPLNKTEENDIVMVRMWIKPEKPELIRMKTFSEKSGSFTVNFQYADHPYNLPDKMVVKFDVKNQKMPVSITGDYESIGKDLEEKDSATGEVIIDYINYKVNRGLPDSIFQ